jgi:hypothetical protein
MNPLVGGNSTRGVAALVRTLLVIGVLCSAARAAAQPADVYSRLLDLYLAQPAIAAERMAMLPEREIGGAIQRCRQGHCSMQRLRIAAMVHGEAAAAVIGPRGLAARDHIAYGRELLQIATNNAKVTAMPPRELARLAQFGGRWYAMSARLLLSHGHFEMARLITQEGRIRYPESPDLFVVLGLLTEWSAGLGWDAGDLRGFIIRGEPFNREFGTLLPPRGNAARELEIAAGEYRRALALDSTHMGARLRLAWIHLLGDDDRVWDDLSLEFVTDATRESHYVARLLRGTAAERRAEPSYALAEYEAARSVMPHSQTACVAVSSAQASVGRLEDARRTAIDCLNRGADAAAIDGWTLFRMGLPDTTTLEELRAEARRP